MNAQTGPYDELYASSEQLWPDRPGRIVRDAADRLPPGRALDLGCGDGKNSVFLAQRGWRVDGCDISQLALHRFRARLRRANITAPGTYVCASASELKVEHGYYDLVLAYGLFHCLDGETLRRTRQTIATALRPGGSLALAALTPDVPLPADHRTPGLHLRAAAEILGMFGDWTIITATSGEIVEEHPPIVAHHRHSVLWAMLRKPQ